MPQSMTISVESHLLSETFAEDSTIVDSTAISKTTTRSTNPRNTPVEGESKRQRARIRRSRQSSALDNIDPQRWNSFPRLSTALEDANQSITGSRFDDLKFSSDELLETYNGAYSSDDEDIIRPKESQAKLKDDSKHIPSVPTRGPLRRALSVSSAKATSKLKRMSTVIRRVPSSFSFRTTSHEITASPEETSPEPSTSKQCQRNRRQSLQKVLSWVSYKGKENILPQQQIENSPAK